MMTRFDREAYELQLHRRARAGDAGAKRTIEVRELREKADENARQLRDKAEKGDAQAMTALRRLASGTASPAPHVAINGITRGDVERAAAAATKAEQERWGKVFASDASRGRERNCASLLTADKGWSAASIINELPHLPTDAQTAAGTAGSAEASDAVWSNARKIVDAQRKARGGTSSSTGAAKDGSDASDPWSKARKVLDAQRKAHGGVN